MISNNKLEKVTREINRALTRREVKFQVTFNPAHGIDINKKLFGVEFEFPNQDIDYIKINIKKSITNSEALQLINSISEASIALKIMNDVWIDFMSLNAGI